MNPKRSSWQRGFWVVSASVFIALVLSILPPPQLLFYFWPDWVALVLVYWALMLPQRVGPWTAFLVGLIMEALFVKSFGVIGLGLATLVFAVNRTHLQLRVLSIWQQMIVIGLFLAIFKLVTGWLYGMISGFDINTEQFYSVLGSVLIWPFIYIVLQELRRSAKLD